MTCARPFHAAPRKETVSNRGLIVLQAQRTSLLPGCNRMPYLAADLIERGMHDDAELQ